MRSYEFFRRKAQEQRELGHYAAAKELMESAKKSRRIEKRTKAQIRKVERMRELSNPEAEDNDPLEGEKYNPKPLRFDQRFGIS